MSLTVVTPELVRENVESRYGTHTTRSVHRVISSIDIVRRTQRRGRAADEGRRVV